MEQRRTVVYQSRARGGYGPNLDIADDPFSPQLATLAKNFDDAILELRIETLASRDRPGVLILVQRIENPEANVPIQLDPALGSTESYMAPLLVSLRLVSGTASKIRDGILTIRLRPRRRPDGGND